MSRSLMVGALMPTSRGPATFVTIPPAARQTPAEKRAGSPVAGLESPSPGSDPGMKVGLFLSSEEYGPHELIEQARLAADAGLAGLWISDHYRPWLDTQGQSPFVWSTIGAVSQACDLPIMTAVTCPTLRIPPAVIAQAAA